jgi:hypothetical protein
VTLDQFRAGLANLDYSAEDIALYVKSITITPPVLPKLPSAGELRGFYNAGAIDITQYRTSLATLGYTAEVVEWFVVIAANVKVTVPKLLSTAELKSFYVAGIITIEQAQLGLAAIGYSATDVARYRALWTAPKE